MKRLLEVPAADRLMARAHALVRAVGPTVESEERLLRMRRALDAPRPRSAPRWALRFALAAGLLGASAAAAAGSGVLSAVLAPGPSSAIAPRAPAPPTARAKPPVAPSVAAKTDPGETVPEPPKPVVAPRGNGARSAPATGSDVARVHEAAIALRRDGDPGRALQLLEASGKPISGPLAEEALALRIEASAARHDGRQAKLAAAYLARYPNGRYRELAKKALAGPEP